MLAVGSRRRVPAQARDPSLVPHEQRVQRHRPPRHAGPQRKPLFLGADPVVVVRYDFTGHCLERILKHGARLGHMQLRLDAPQPDMVVL